jgi:glycosyltransferase involved in cell wall biosynthesis
VVASDVGGISDIVSDGRTGILVPPGNSEGITNALLRLLDDPGLATQLGARGRRRIERLFDARTWAENLRSCYERAVAAHSVGRRAA